MSAISKLPVFSEEIGTAILIILIAFMVALAIGVVFDILPDFMYVAAGGRL